MSKSEKTLNRILDAALVCYEAHGIGQTRLDDVAREAGVGRTTLYRYIDNRDDLLNKVVLRDARAQEAELEVLNRQHDKLADSIVDTIVHVIRGRRTRPINRLLFGEGDSAVIDRINLSPSNFYAMAQGLLEPQFRRAQARGELREGVELAAASQWLARVILSLVTYPEEFLDNDEALRDFLWRFLVPSLVADAPA